MLEWLTGIDEAKKQFDAEFESFRQRYVLRFTPTGVEPAGWHKLEDTLTRPGKTTIEARRGYFGG